MRKNHLILLLLFMSFQYSQAQEIIPLWPDKQMPNHQPSDEKEYEEWGDIPIKLKFDIQVPTIEVFLPTRANATGQAILITPGGGYGCLAYEWEGTDMAKFLNSKGIAAFVLKYRLPISKSVVDPKEVPLQDARRAIRLIRSRSEEWDISSDKVGMMGFSAGGHLAATLAVHHDHENYSVIDSVDNQLTRPDFLILGYPVVTMKQPVTHDGSRTNLLGDNPSDDLVNFYSNELHVNNTTPPTFILHASDDEAVPMKNSLLFYDALIESGVAAEIHTYPFGGHGFALAVGKGHLENWTQALSDWLKYINQ